MQDEFTGRDLGTFSGAETRIPSAGGVHERHVREVDRDGLTNQAV